MIVFIAGQGDKGLSHKWMSQWGYVGLLKVELPYTDWPSEVRFFQLLNFFRNWPKKPKLGSLSFTLVQNFPNVGRNLYFRELKKRKKVLPL